MVHGVLNDIEAGLVESSYSKNVRLFKKMNLDSNLLRGLYAHDFACPSAVQQRAIPPAIQGHDIVTAAQSAAGKTSALCISVLQKIDPSIQACQALILASDGNVAEQIQKTIIDIGCFMQISRPASIFKSSDARDDMDVLPDAQQVVIGEPAQVYDMIGCGTIATANVNLLMVDDADELSSSNIAEQICGIRKLLPEPTQVVFLSTTTPHEVFELAEKVMRDPLYIMVGQSEYPLEGIKQSYKVVKTEDRKLDILCELDESSALAQGIVFCNTRKKLEWLEQELTGRGLDTAAMHGDMRADHRAAMMADFRSSGSRVLIATEMLARGLDPQRMAVVVNFELPTNPEKYVHRTGLGRHSDWKAPVINLITADEKPKLREIEQFYKTRIEKMH